MDFINRDKEWFLSCLHNTTLIKQLKKISLIITDVDGCLTNGTAQYSGDDEIAKSFSIQDGFMMTKCNKPGMPHLAFITGRTDAAATKRAKKLGVPDELYYQGVCTDKSHAVAELQTKRGVTKEETLFFGDDVLDLQVQSNVGLFASPTNALFYVQSYSNIIVPRRGGNGALRLLLDLLLYVQQKHLAQAFIEKALQE